MSELKPRSITEDGKARMFLEVPESSATSTHWGSYAGAVYYQEVIAPSGDHELTQSRGGPKHICLLSLTTVPGIFTEGCQESLPSLISPSFFFFPPSMMSLLFGHLYLTSSLMVSQSNLETSPEHFPRNSPEVSWAVLMTHKPIAEGLRYFWFFIKWSTCTLPLAEFAYPWEGTEGIVKWRPETELVRLLHPNQNIDIEYGRVTSKIWFHGCVLSS